ncbi:MAG TPA: hypothetical protein VKJ01_03800 [Candidatus Solibacter sp.]|nr:hypothetical protein [Candidatus Solibacter sp.]
MKAQKAQTGAEQVREYAKVNYIERARKQHESIVQIVAGDVHKALHLEGRVPSVCQALSGPKFLEENHLTLEKREGPPSGQSTTVVFTYRLVDEQPAPDGLDESPLLRLWGIGKEAFASLGGAEAFIRRERERFYQHDDDL